MYIVFMMISDNWPADGAALKIKTNLFPLSNMMSMLSF